MAALKGEDFCWAHHPDYKAQARARRSSGGKASQAKKKMVRARKGKREKRAQEAAKASAAPIQPLDWDVSVPEGGFGSAAEVKTFLEHVMLGAAKGYIGSTAVGGIVSTSKLLIAKFFADGDAEPAGTPDELKKLSNRELQVWMAERLPTHVLEAELERRKEQD
jgi:hypothetical protein